MLSTRGADADGPVARPRRMKMLFGSDDRGPREADRPARRARIAAGLALLAFSAFLPALRNGFVASWDDGKNLLINPNFRGLGARQFAWAWRTTLLGVY